MGKKLGNAPLFYTLGQLVFNNVPELEDHIPAIRARMREAGFPDLQKDITQRLVFRGTAGDLASTPPPTYQEVGRYIFGDIASRNAFFLNENSLSLQTTDYQTFEDFSALFLKGIALVADVLPLDFFERVGIRYLNVIHPKDGEAVEDYLASPLQGLPVANALVRQTNYETGLVMDGDLHFLFRVKIQPGDLPIPNEFSKLSQTVKKHFRKSTPVHGLIDLDGAYFGQQAFEIDTIRSKLRASYNELAKAFAAITTDLAKATWAA